MSEIALAMVPAHGTKDAWKMARPAPVPRWRAARRIRPPDPGRATPIRRRPRAPQQRLRLPWRV